MYRFFAPLLALLLIGCSGAGRLAYDSPEEAYTKGMESFRAEEYDRAIELFQGVFDFGRTHEWAADAQLMLARSYRANQIGRAHV